MDSIPPLGSLPPMFPIFFPGIFNSLEDRDDFLSSLDSDTRNYVNDHTSDFNSRSDLIDCVNRLHGNGPIIK